MKNSLNFNKSAVAELNSAEMRSTDSGVTPTAFILLGWTLYEIYDNYNGTED